MMMRKNLARLLLLQALASGAQAFAGPGANVRSTSAASTSSSSTSSVAQQGLLQQQPRPLGYSQLSRRLQAASLPSEAAEEHATALEAATSLRGGMAAGMRQRLKLGMLFFLWYSLNIGYNITNKRTLNMIRIPFTLSAFQLLVGSLYVLPLWLTGLRKAPKLSMQELKTVMPMGFCHMASHLAAVISLGAGAVSFTHIVKAAEPLFTATLSALFLGQIFPLPVYAALLPVVGGVGLASLHELNFSWTAFGGAMGSNLAASTRGILAKKSMGKPQGKNMTPANLYAVLTMLATVMLLPLAAIFEGRNVAALWETAISKGATPALIAQGSILSGLFFYLYNEVAFLALNEVHPVTHAVGNTFKRVFVIASSIFVFRTPVTSRGLLGSAIAILGVMVYSLLKNYYSTKAVVAKSSK